MSKNEPLHCCIVEPLTRAMILPLLLVLSVCLFVTEHLNSIKQNYEEYKRKNETELQETDLR